MGLGGQIGLTVPCLQDLPSDAFQYTFREPTSRVIA